MNRTAKMLIFKKLDEVGEKQKAYKEEHKYSSDSLTAQEELLIELALDIMKAECEEEKNAFNKLTAQGA